MRGINGGISKERTSLSLKNVLFLFCGVFGRILYSAQELEIKSVVFYRQIG